MQSSSPSRQIPILCCVFPPGRFCNWGGDNLLGNEIGGDNFVVRKREGDKSILVRIWEGDCDVPRSKMGG